MTVPVDLPDGMITATDEVRLAALGITLTPRPPVGLPKPGLRVHTSVFLSASMGVVGAIYTREREGAMVPYIDPLQQAQLESYIVEALGQRALHELPYYWDIEHYLRVFEGIAAQLAIMGIPHDCMGDMWAVHCLLTRPPIRRPRHLKHIGRALLTLGESGVPPRMFYEHLYRINNGQVGQTPKLLERAVAASVFQVEHPGVNPVLARELFA